MRLSLPKRRLIAAVERHIALDLSASFIGRHSSCTSFKALSFFGDRSYVRWNGVGHDYPPQSLGRAMVSVALGLFPWTKSS